LNVNQAPTSVTARNAHDQDQGKRGDLRPESYRAGGARREARSRAPPRREPRADGTRGDAPDYRPVAEAQRRRVAARA
jgi:hypothetical protein